MKTTVLAAFLITLSVFTNVALADPGGVRFSLIKTSGSTTLDALTYSGGKWFSLTRMNHVAVLVEHPKGRFLFDSGLGRDIDAQYDKDMPYWMRTSFKYDPTTPARDQLEQAGMPLPERIILSHAHWDHGSGVHDFPQAEIWITEAERAYIQEAPSGPVLHSQFTNPQPNWHEYSLQDKPWRRFDKSLDLFGDGSVVLLNQAGHTPGSVALYLRTLNGKEYLLSGDTVWRARALESAAPKSLIARWIVDHDTHRTLERVEQLASFSTANPDVVIVPAHDAEVHDRLGYFPEWVD